MTDYINQFLGAPPPGSTGGRGNAVALARSVLQRRLASSLGAIRSSLANRAQRLSDQADEIERLPLGERRKYLAEMARRPLDAVDDESDIDDADEDAEERAADRGHGCRRHRAASRRGR